jgi:hypothetical protein
MHMVIRVNYRMTSEDGLTCSPSLDRPAGKLPGPLYLDSLAAWIKLGSGYCQAASLFRFTYPLCLIGAVPGRKVTVISPMEPPWNLPSMAITTAG